VIITAKILGALSAVAVVQTWRIAHAAFKRPVICGLLLLGIVLYVAMR
jgi:hypothetical protein